MNRPLRLAALLILPLSLLLLNGGGGIANAVATTADIASTGPLTHVYIGTDLSCQVAHEGDTDLELFPPDELLGDCGTFLLVDGTLYSPDLTSRPSAAEQAQGIAFTPVSQSGVLGSGTAGDPYTVVTVVDAGSVRITETDSYIVGQESYRTDVQLTNNGASSSDLRLYRAGDCFLGGSDEGYGVTIPATKTVACTKNANNSPPDRIEQWSPITPADHFFEEYYNTVWDTIGMGAELPDTCICTTLEDNGAAIDWNRTLAAGASLTISHLTTFSPVGELPVQVTKAAELPAVDPSATDSYTITVTNPSAAQASVDNIIDVLPPGFAYVSGSTTGATTANPSVAAQVLTWAGPFNIPGSSSITLTFDVTVSSVPGLYMNSATTSGGADVVPSGPTAPVTVNAVVTATATATATATETPGESDTSTPTPVATATSTPTATATAPAGATETPTAQGTTTATPGTRTATPGTRTATPGTRTVTPGTRTATPPARTVTAQASATQGAPSSTRPCRRQRTRPRPPRRTRRRRPLPARCRATRRRRARTPPPRGPRRRRRPRARRRLPRRRR
jgi:uncharacterized repeat protein (TIGR01451 family)